MKIFKSHGIQPTHTYFQVVYFDWVVGNEIDEIEGIFEHPNGANVEGPVTSMDRSNEVIHNELRKIRDFQVTFITRVVKVKIRFS